MEALGLQAPQASSHDQLVPLAVIVKDIQFRGAISDFHASRALIKGADYSLLVLRSNVEDIYGDGNNFEARGACNLFRQPAEKPPVKKQL